MEFRWGVAAGGYVWADDHRLRRRTAGRPVSDGRVLVPADLRGAEKRPGDEDFDFVATGTRGLASRWYYPLREASGLFRTLAETPPTEDGVRRFADRYGLLGPDVTDSPANPPGARIPEEARANREMVTDFHSVAESLDDWRFAITNLKAAVALFDDLPPGRTGPVAKELQVLVERRLEATGVVPRFRLDPAPVRHPPLHLAPLTLHAAMWLQLAQVASADQGMRQCGECGGWFVLDPDVNRVSRQYCSGPCRSRAYRARKARARELRAAKVPLRKIAAELESDLATVRGWVSSGGAK